MPHRLTLRSASDPSARESSVFSVWVLPETDASLPTCRWNSYSPRRTKGSPVLSHRSQFSPLHGDLSPAMNYEARTTASWGARSLRLKELSFPQRRLKALFWIQAYPPTPETYIVYPLWLRSPRIPAPWGTQSPPPSYQYPKCEGDHLHQQLGVHLLLRRGTRHLLDLLSTLERPR